MQTSAIFITTRTRKGFHLFRLKVARSIGEIQELRPAWDSLHSLSTLSMFQSYLWNRKAAEIFADNEEPFFIFSQSDSGAAIIPAVIERHSKAIGLAGERLFDYRDYLAMGDPAPLIRAWHRLSELGLPMSVTAINRPQDAAWGRLPKTHFSDAPQLLHREVTPHDFTKKHARAFNRLRRLQRMGLRICQYSGDSPVVRHIYELRARQSENNELFRDPKRVDFMVAICREAGSQCEVFTLGHGGSTLAAALITFRDGNFRRCYTTYYDREWARYSPGVSLLFEVVRRSVDEGLNVDLMTGEQSYKIRIASAAQKLFQVNATAAEVSEAFLDSLCKDVAA